MTVYENQSKQVMKVRKQQVQTNRTIANNKLDIIICDNKQGTCIFIGVAIPGDRNVIKREIEKILKYIDLKREIQHMWSVKVKMILVIIVVTGTISKPLRQYLSNIPGKHVIKEVQKTAILGTAHKLQEVLM